MAAANRDYQLLSLEPGSAHFRFIGPFAGREVVWDAKVQALGLQAAAQYIDIGQCEGDCVPVNIGLVVSELQSPDLLKTMFMIRQYKRLKPGRHEFSGPAKKND